jgi:hypothetical protein
VIDAGLIEQLAQAVHENYLREQLADGAVMGTAEALRPWAELDEDLREANRAQARDIAAKVDEIGAVVAQAEPGAPPFAFTAAELDRLAREEHARWSAQRRRAGWKYGKVRDNSKKVHPFLVSWEKLPEAEKQKDRDAVLNIPAVLARVGLAVVRPARA